MWVNSICSFSPPPYWEEEDQGATAYAAHVPEQALIDESGQEVWSAVYVALRAEFMAAPDLPNGWSDQNVTTDGLRDGLRRQEWEQLLRNDLMFAARRGERRNLGLITVALLDFLNSVDDPDRSLAEVFLKCADNQPEIEAGFVAALKLSGKSELATFAEGLEARIRLRQKPMELCLPTLSGEKIDLASLRGKVVLVDFWSSSCSSCVAAMPKIKDVYERYHGRGFEVVAICLDREINRPMVEAILAKIGTSWPTAWVELEQSWQQTPLVEQFAITSVPVYFLLDRAGRLVSTDVSGPRLEKAVRSLLELGTKKGAGCGN